MIEYPNFLDKIFEKLDKNNAKIFIVGGFVRDYLLNIASYDIDIEVYNISSFEELENILKEFGTISSVGKSFGVCKLHYKNLFLDFTLPRIDSKISSGHSGFDISIEKNLDFKSAARRRDFSMNAIGYDVLNKKLLDPFDGIHDLKSKTLKMIDASTFIQDPLRVLRAVQFCARFDLKMDTKLFSICFDMVEKNMLYELPKERIYGEIKKLLLQSHKPSLGFELLKKLGALKFLLQCSNSMQAIDKMVKLKTTNIKTNEVLMLASLCYNFNSTQIQDLLSKLSNDKALLKRVVILVENLSVIPKLCSNEISDYELFKLSTKVNIQELIIVSKAVYGIGEELAKRAKELNILHNKMPAILQGRDLIIYGIKPSAKFLKILNAAYEAQMHKKFNSYDEAILWLNNYLS